MKKSELISLRLGREDVEFISALGEDYGKTTSEKIRKIITEAKLEESSDRVKGKEKNLENFLDEISVILKGKMREKSVKSEVLDLSLEFLSNSLHFLTQLKDSEISNEVLKNLELKMIDELFDQFDKSLRLGLSKNSKIINNEEFGKNLKSLMFLLKTVENYTEKKGS